mgnify:CR=1 FL=1
MVGHRIEPITLLGALSSVTERIGLVATATTTYLDPFHVARMFATLDQLSEGRVGWNVVTSSAASEALNFSHAAHAPHDQRYERAAEFIEVVQGPDFPTGGFILGREGIYNYFKTGRGSLKLRAKAATESIGKDREAIVITEIPYQVQKAKLIERIAALMDEKKLPFLADIRDAQGVSVAWLPQADWGQWPWRTLAGAGPLNMVAPYPASLLKLMVAVGVGMAIDWSLCRWDQPWPFAQQVRTIAQWGEDMIVTSSNEATSALVALLHALGLINEQADPEAHHALHHAFESRGLHTLRLAGTRLEAAARPAAG